jgi:hypothetical protein
MPNPDGSATEAEQNASHLDALERAVAGAEHRLAELLGMEGAHPNEIASAEATVAASKSQLKDAVKAAPAAEKKSRPRKAAETR